MASCRCVRPALSTNPVLAAAVAPLFLLPVIMPEASLAPIPAAAPVAAMGSSRPSCLNCEPPDGGFGDEACALRAPNSLLAGQVGNMDGSMGKGSSLK